MPSTQRSTRRYENYGWVMSAGLNGYTSTRTNYTTRDLINEYQKVEKYVSLNESEIVVEERVKAEFEERLGRLESQSSTFRDGSPELPDFLEPIQQLRPRNLDGIQRFLFAHCNLVTSVMWGRARNV